MNDTLTSTPSGRPDRDLQPLGLAVRAVLRAIVPVATIAALAGILALSVFGDDDPDVTVATARLGLTDEVVWPFYDAARDRVDVTVSSADFRAEVEAQIGTAVDQIRLDIPDNQAYVDLEVEAPDRPTAEAGRDAAVAIITEESLRTRRIELETEIQLLQADLAEAEGLAAEVEIQLDEAIARQVAINAQLVETPSDIDLLTENRTLDSVRSRLITERDGHVRTAQTLQRDLDELERDLANAQPEVELLRFDAESADASSTWPIVAGVALAAAAVAAIAAVIVDRERGRLRDPWYVEGAVGVTHLGSVRVGPDGTARGLFATTDAVLDGIDDGARVIGVVGDGAISAEQGIAQLAEGLRAADRRALQVLGPEDGTDPDPDTPIDLMAAGGVVRVAGQPSATALDSFTEAAADPTPFGYDLVLIDLDGDYVDDERFRTRSRACDRVLIVTSPTNRVHRLRNRIRSVAVGGVPLFGAIVLPAG